MKPSGKSGNADIVLVNGKVITVDGPFRVTEAVAVEGGRFSAVGTNDEVRATAGPETKVIDLAGKAVVPGFIDTHGHIGLFGLEKNFVNLDGARSIGEICSRVAAADKQLPAGFPIVTTPVGDHPFFFNVPEILEERRFPNRWDLDKAAPDRAIYITAPTNRVPNSAVFNSTALQLGGLTKDSVPHGPPNRVRITHDAYWLDGIEVVRDPATGEPTGELRNMQPIYNPSSYYPIITGFLPPFTYEFIREGIRQMAPEFLACGTTTLLENHLTVPEEFRAYAELDLPLRVFFTFDIDPTKSPEELDTWFRTIGFATGKGWGNDRVGVAGVSLGLDGPHWHGTAYTGEPYMGPFGEVVTPEPLVPRDVYQRVMWQAARHGFRIHAEGAGRGSIGLMLETMSEINEEIPIKDRRFILEHCEFPTKEQIAECKRLGIIPTTTTNFVWGKGAEVYLERLGKEYAEQAIPLRWWLDGGVPVCQETDWGPHETMFTIWQSMARHAGLTGEVVGPDQRITREEALRIFTNNCAYALFMEDDLGSIETGKLADLVVLSDDPLSCPEDDIKDIEVLATMVGGHFVYEKEALG